MFGVCSSTIIRPSPSYRSKLAPPNQQPAASQQPSLSAPCLPAFNSIPSYAILIVVCCTYTGISKLESSRAQSVNHQME